MYLNFIPNRVASASNFYVPGRSRMEELITRIAAEAGIAPETAEKAVGMILGFLRKEGPPAGGGALFAAVPGATEAAAGGASGGAPEDPIDVSGSGLMGLAGQLTNLGLGMG